MHVRAGVRVAVVLSGACLMLEACGGAGPARGPRAAAAGPVPEVVKQMQAPESPYYLIYYPAVNLAKQPERKPRS